VHPEDPISIERTAWNLLGLLYDAPGSPDAWRTFLSALCAEMSAPAVGFLLGIPRSGRPGVLISNGVRASDEWTDRVTRPYTVQPESFRDLPEGGVFVVPPGEAHERFATSAFHQHVLEPAGLRGTGFLAALVGRDDEQAHTFLLLTSREAWRPTERDVALMEHLAPHCVRAAALHDRLLRQDVVSSAVRAALDQLVLGVVLLDFQGNVAYANRSTADMLGVEPGGMDPALRGTDADARTRVLRDWLPGHGGRPDGASVLRHPVDGRPLLAFSAPLAREDRDGESTPRDIVVVFIGDPHLGDADTTDAPGDLADVLGELYRLTPAEARLARALLADRTLEDAATALGVTIGTARTTLKRIFSKTGTHRQSSLIRLLLMGPGQVRPPA